MNKKVKEKKMNEDNSFPLPNWSQIPNFIIDEWMKKLSHAEFKIIMLIFRYTSGFHRRQAAISFNHFSEQCGVDKKWVKEICKKLEGLGWITITHGNHMVSNIYEINIQHHSKKDYLGESVPQGGGVSHPGVGESVPHNKERDIKKKRNNNRAATVPNGASASVVVSSKRVVNGSAILPHQEKKPQVYDCLSLLEKPRKDGRDISVPENVKVEVSSKYTEDQVKEAVRFLMLTPDEFTKGATAALRWACKEQPRIEDKDQQKTQNIQTLKNIKDRLSKSDGVSVGAGGFRVPVMISGALNSMKVYWDVDVADHIGKISFGCGPQYEEFEVDDKSMKAKLLNYLEKKCLDAVLAPIHTL